MLTLATAYDYDRLIKALLLAIAARAEADQRDRRRRHQSSSRRVDDAERLAADNRSDRGEST